MVAPIGKASAFARMPAFVTMMTSPGMIGADETGDALARTEELEPSPAFKSK
jgi:hypothetical protein